MKNKLINNFKLAILVVLFSTTNTAYAHGAKLRAMKPMIEKYAIVMVAIVVVSFALYVGLSIYNRLLAMKKLKNFTESNSSLKTPETVENSITMYITKNRLK
ncbi:unknown [Clostridium sp. CAG:813]|nr:unknown [Clostridium sp. CAG:813]